MAQTDGCRLLRCRLQNIHRSRQPLPRGIFRLMTSDSSARIADMLVPSPHRPFREWELAAVFHWIASVKDFFVKKFPISFLRQIQTHSQVRNSTIHKTDRGCDERTDTRPHKGDISQRKKSSPCHAGERLVELDSQAREYQELKAKTK